MGHTMQAAVGYLRVSTQEQGRSGLGLAAQRFDIEAFGTREGFSVKSWYQDIQTGAGKDALLMRPGLAAALKEARAARCPLIVSRLDRLSRNVYFITGLMEHKVHFVVAALGRDCDDFTLHIYASLAEQERKMIGERVRAALARSKKKLGISARSKAYQRRFAARGRAAQAKIEMQQAEASRPHVEWVLQQPGRYGRPISVGAAAAMLNERNIPSPRGGRWCGGTVMRTGQRLGLHHRLTVAHRFVEYTKHRRLYWGMDLPVPLYNAYGSRTAAGRAAVAKVRRQVAEAHRLKLRHSQRYLINDAVLARVRAIWIRQPGCTAKQMVASLGAKHPVGICRTKVHLRECRTAAAKRSQAQRVEWHADRWTATRIRISDMLKRHPQFTAKQVIEKLGPKYSAKLQWVQKVMREYRGHSATLSPKQRRIGRRT
jgi:DNA invertase Pin-like site-specific DNA recombinase